MEAQISKVEVKGIEALFYDQIMSILTGFSYDYFIRKAIEDMRIEKNDKIMDLGSGTAKNICIMKKYTDSLIVGLDKGREMLYVSKKRCANYNNVKIFCHDIRDKTPFIDEFDKVFISFVLHGFIDDDRNKIIESAYSSLKKGGKFYILDYNEFDINNKSSLVKLFFKYGECPLASEFIRLNIKEKLKSFGFIEFEEHYYYLNLVRLLIATK